MKITEMTTQDLHRVLPLYLDYYNNVEGGQWTDKTAGRRIRQVLTMQDSFSLIMTEEDEVIGFVMGYFKQYDDIVGYTLEEIIIAKDRQGKGLGRILLEEVEKRAKDKGASCVELQAVADDMHERYYGKAGYKNAKNFVLKVKWFD